MKHIVAFSGGKDSTATAIHCKNNLKEEFEIVFCDTGWEHPMTYNFIDYFENKIGVPIQKLISSKYSSFEEMTISKGSHYSIKRRFCTLHLKVEPMIDFILDNVQSDSIIYQGIRWQESKNRSMLSKTEDYFHHYLHPRISKNKKTGKVTRRKDTYRKTEVLEYIKKYSTTAARPIIDWSHTQTMEYIAKNGFRWNPLYDLGYSRVGCFPCVGCSLGEVALMVQNGENERFDKIREMEQITGSTFFGQGMIPDRYCTKVVEYKCKKTGVLKTRKVPLVDDVIRYVKDRKLKQQGLFASSCKNIYMPCE